MIKKLQNIVAPLCCLAFILFIGFRLSNYLKTKNYQAEKNDATDFIAPLSHHEIKPLNTEIDFVDVKRAIREIQTNIETTWGYLTFSTYGASLERFIAKRHTKDTTLEIPILFPMAQTNREHQCFLVGFAEKTPYYYNLVRHTTNDDTIEISYKTETDTIDIHKTFIIHNLINKIDLNLEIIPKNTSVLTIQPRIVYPSPYMPHLDKKETIASIIIDKDGLFKKTTSEKLDMQQGWFKPHLFGSEDKYFINVLLNDENHFVQRAYYNLINNKNLLSFLEGPTIQQSSSWHLSFYIGPKEMNSLQAVDNRLEDTLGYTGILASLSRLLLYALHMLYEYLGSYGWAIVALIAIMQLLMIPFTLRGEKSTKQAKEYQKKMAYIQQRYKNDREALARARAELVQKHGMPGLGGCLPVLLFRMPTFFALQQVLNNAIELYKAPFLWISDLSMPDPYYIFPLLVAGGIVAQAFTVDAGQRAQLIIMALIIGGVTTTLSAGLALYITVSTFLGVLQTTLTHYFKLA